MFPFVYRFLSAAYHKVPLPHSKLACSLAGRRAAETRWIEWASKNRTNRPLIWVHGASVGENLSAVPVVTRLRTAKPGLQVVYSYTSPSATSWHGVFGGDRADFLPPEEPDSIGRVLKSVRPDLLVFSRGDIWPVMAQVASEFGVPIAVVGGTVNPASRRLWPVVRRVLTPTYRSVNWIGAVSRADADRWISLGASAHTTAVTGDPRHDQVLERHTDLSAISPLLRWCSGSTVLVAGSTEKQDEEVLLEVFSRMVRSETHNTRLMIAPHDVSRSRIKQVTDTAMRKGIAVNTWDGNQPSQQTQCVVVEKMGVLADLYAVGQIGYVGGGFGRGGLHAVVEPAAFAVPVIAGPDHTNSRDFGVLLKAQGAIALPKRGSENTLYRTWTNWVTDPQHRIATGLRARSTLQQGAAKASALALLRLMSQTATQ